MIKISQHKRIVDNKSLNAGLNTGISDVSCHVTFTIKCVIKVLIINLQFKYLAI